MGYDCYEDDSRVRAGRNRQDKMVVTLYDDDAEGDEVEIEVELPTRFEVCPTCEGRGSHTNPSIDCNGLSSEDFEQDPDFREDYFSGVYDVQCYGCGGRRVVPVVDERRCDPKHLELYYRQLEARAELEGMYASERRMGA